MTPQDYIDALRPHLPRHFAPGGIYHGAEGAKRLAHEVGYGLGSYTDDQIRDIRATLYSDLLVRNTLTSRAGVPIDNRTFQDHLQIGIDRCRSYKPPI